MQTNTYFPPIVDTYNEGFLIEKGQCNIKFTLSPYTDKSNIKTIWVSVRDPKTNKSLVTGAENFEKLEAIYQPAAAILYNDIDGQYTFTLDTRYIQGGWQAEKTYKIQLRFCAASENIKFDTQADVLAHIDDFSEWSSATLVTPTKDFSFTSSSPTLDNQQVMSAYANIISGTVDYGRTGEYLTDYRIVITDNGTPVFDSNYQHTDTTNPNTIRQKLTVGLELGKTYHFKYYLLFS